MTIAVDFGRKATNKQTNKIFLIVPWGGLRSVIAALPEPILPCFVPNINLEIKPKICYNQTNILYREISLEHPLHVFVPLYINHLVV